MTVSIIPDKEIIIPPPPTNQYVLIIHFEHGDADFDTSIDYIVDANSEDGVKWLQDLLVKLREIENEFYSDWSEIPDSLRDYVPSDKTTDGQSPCKHTGVDVFYYDFLGRKFSVRLVFE